MHCIRMFILCCPALSVVHYSAHVVTGNLVVNIGVASYGARAALDLTIYCVLLYCGAIYKICVPQLLKLVHFSFHWKNVPSVLWHCWLGGRKGIRPVKKLSSEVLVWLSVWSEVQTCILPSRCHCHSLSLASVKSRLVLPFRYRLTRVVPDKGLLNGCVWKKWKGYIGYFCRPITVYV